MYEPVANWQGARTWYGGCEVFEPGAARVSLISHCHTATPLFKLLPSLSRIFKKSWQRLPSWTERLTADIRTETGGLPRRIKNCPIEK